MKDWKRLGGAFYNCELLESITLPSTLVEIGQGAFHGCSNLREVIFNEGLQEIGDYAFTNCTSLESITLPSTLLEIGYDAFQNCSNLRKVTLNEGLQKIDSIFFNCTSLECITIPSTVSEIVNYGDVRTLQQFEGGRTEWGSTIFGPERICILPLSCIGKNSISNHIISPWEYYAD